MQYTSHNKRPASLNTKDTKSQKVIQPVSLMSSNDNNRYRNANGEDNQQSAVPGNNHSNSHKLMHQNSHSNPLSKFQLNNIGVGRDLQGMGLITQVKQGEDAPRVTGLTHVSTSKTNISPMAQKHFGIDLDVGAVNKPLLKPQRPEVKGMKTLVLDLDETLVHSSFKPTKNSDIVIPIDIEGRVCNVYILVRPGCIKFLNEMAKYYEVVIFTASLSKYADPLMDVLDQNKVAPQRLFREHCTFYNGMFVKDMSRLGRPLKDSIIIDNSPTSYMFQPENGMPILSWYEDKNDDKLYQLIPVLKAMSEVNDVRPVLLECTRDNQFNCEKALHMCARLNSVQNAKRLDDREFTSTMDQCRVTTDEYEGIEENMKKVKGMSNSINEKIIEKNYKMNSLKIATHAKIAKNNNEEYAGGQSPLINTWITNDSESDIKISANRLREGERKSSQRKAEALETPIGKSYRDNASTSKYSSTPQAQTMKSKDAIVNQRATESSSRYRNATNTQYQTTTDNVTKKGTQTPQSSSVQKRRPKTASKDNLVESSTQLKKQMSTQHSAKGLVTPSRHEIVDSKKKQIIVSSNQINFTSSKDRIINSNQTPQNVTSKSSFTMKMTRGSSATTSSTSKIRPTTAQTSSRNSVERERNKQKTSGRPGSSKRYPQEPRDNNLAIYSATPQSTKNYTLGSYLTGVTKKMEAHTPVQGSFNQQMYAQSYQSTTYQSSQLEITPNKSQGVFMNKLNQPSYSPMIQNNKQYSSTKKTKQPSTSSSTNRTKTPTENNSFVRPMTNNSKTSSMKESRTPGKIFNFDKTNKRDVSPMNKEDGYSTLLKNVSATSLKNGRITSSSHNSQSQQKQAQNSNIKGVKIVNNQNALLINKYSNASYSHYSNGQSHNERETGVSTSTKHSKINNMMHDYDRTKTFNQELLKNIGSPKGPVFARISNPYAHYQEQEVRNV